MTNRNEYKITRIEGITWTPPQNQSAYAINACAPDEHDASPEACTIHYTLCGVVRENSDPRYGDAEYLLYAQEVYAAESVPVVKEGNRLAFGQVAHLVKPQHPQHGVAMFPANILRAYGDIYGITIGKHEEELMSEQEQLVPLTMTLATVKRSKEEGGFMTSAMSVEFTPVTNWEDTYAQFLRKDVFSSDGNPASRLFNMLAKILGDDASKAEEFNDGAGVASLVSAMSDAGGPMILELLLAAAAPNNAGSSIVRTFSGGITFAPPQPQLLNILSRRTREGLREELSDWHDAYDEMKIWGQTDTMRRLGWDPSTQRWQQWLGDQMNDIENIKPRKRAEELLRLSDAIQQMEFGIPFMLASLAHKAYTIPVLSETMEEDGDMDACVIGMEMKAVRGKDEDATPVTGETVRHHAEGNFTGVTPPEQEPDPAADMSQEMRDYLNSLFS